jgi:LacI family transcriptional regulator
VPPLDRHAMAYPHKSQKIAETIAKWFEDGKYRPGDRFPSDQELAKKFSVNHVTVRTALKRFVESGLLDRRVGAGTIVRDPKTVTGGGGAVGDLASGGVAVSIPDATHSFFSEMLRSIEGALLGTGRPLLLGHTWELGHREQQVVSAWVAQGIRSMILAPTIDRPEFYRDLLDRGVRVVFVDRRVPGVPVASITTRDEEGASAMIKFLLDLGHRRFIHLAGPATVWTAQVRRDVFVRATTAAGLKPADRLVLPAGYFAEDGYRAGLAMLAAGEPPDAIFGANDAVAVGAIRALHEKGLRVPDDVSVAGYGDIDLGRNFGLTTVRQFPERIGTEAVRLMLASDDPTESDSIELLPELVARTSTAGLANRDRSPTR